MARAVSVSLCVGVGVNYKTPNGYLVHLTLDPSEGLDCC